jgi:dipeptidyl aminopeptidase/acylaminoacyl peptidase
MRKPVAFAFAGLIAACALSTVVQAALATDTSPTIQQFIEIRTPRGAEMLADGSLLIRDWPDGVYQLYRVIPRSSADGTPSYRPGEATFVKLTDFPDGVSGFSVSPDGRHVVFENSRGGNENMQLTLLDPMAAPGSGATPVVSDPKVRAEMAQWLPDGSGFIYRANQDTPSDFHLYRYDIASAKATQILAREGWWTAADVSTDGRRVLVQHYVSQSDARAYELNLDTGKLTDLTIKPADGTAACRIVGYMPGERAVLLTSDVNEGVSRLYVRDLKSGKVREPIPALSDVELDAAHINDTRDLLVAVANEDGYGAMHVYALPKFEPVPVPEADRGVVFAGQFHGPRLVWGISNARTPGAAYASTWTKTKNKWSGPQTVQVTYTDDRGIALGGMPLPELVKYPSFDGRQIPAFLYLPAGYQKGTAIPFVINYHGGPESQHRPYFDPTMSYLLSRGFGVMKPNVRGSTGYGRAYHMLDNYQKRWDSVRDGVDAAEWLVKQGYAEPGRIATYGGSYGGFMSVACVVEDEERVDRGERPQRMFGAGVDIVGIVNMRTFLEGTKGYRRKLREVEYGPLADTTFLASVSSIHRVNEIQIPMFIAHGFNDPRVPVGEAMQLALALKQAGREPRLFIAPDEGHGFAKLDNRIYFYERCAAFLEETIGGQAPDTHTSMSAPGEP